MLVAPAGAGKTRLMQYVLARTPLRQLPTATTRAIRPGEQEGREHLYLSVEEFQRMIEDSELLEHQVIHGNLYGMPLKAVENALDSGEAIIADIEVLGASLARETYPENVVSIFIQPPAIGSLIERMRERRESEAEIGKRLLRVPLELRYAEGCDYVILNDKFDHAAQLLHKIIEAELSGKRGSVAGDALIPFHFEYTARIIPVYRDEALRRMTTPHDLAAPFTEDTLPHIAALNCLHNELKIASDENALINSDKRDGDYIPPISLEYRRSGDTEQIAYNYLYLLDQRISAPPGWVWTPVEALARALRTVLTERAT